MEQQNFTFGEKKTLCVDDILAVKNGERVGYTVKGLFYKFFIFDVTV